MVALIKNSKGNQNFRKTCEIFPCEIYNPYLKKNLIRYKNFWPALDMLQAVLRYFGNSKCSKNRCWVILKLLVSTLINLKKLDWLCIWYFLLSLIWKGICSYMVTYFYLTFSDWGWSCKLKFASDTYFCMVFFYWNWEDFWAMSHLIWN